MDFRSAEGHPRGDRERQCGRGGQIVEFGVHAATSLQPLQPSMAAQFVPSPGSSSGLGNAILGGQRSAAKVWAPGQSSGRGKQPRTTEISVAETRPFRPSCHSECGSQSRTVSDVTVVDSDEEPLFAPRSSFTVPVRGITRTH